MVDLYLVRHGDTYFEPHGRVKGQLDVRLDPHGRDQAEAVARYFRGAGVDVVICSPLFRTREGAGAVAEATGAPLTVSPLIAERGWGLWQGLAAVGIARERAWGRAAADGFGPLGEPAEEFAERASLFLDVVACRTGQTVVAVTHGGIIKNLVLPAIGLGVTDRRAFTQDTGAISHLQWTGRTWRPVYLNLPPARALEEHPPRPA